MLVFISILVYANPYFGLEPPILLKEDGLITQRTNSFIQLENIDESSKINITDRTKSDYISSHVQFIHCYISKYYAYGQYYINGGGGAIFMIDSQLYISNCTFEKCWANVGGAIAMQASKLVINGPTYFIRCFSYIAGGAIFQSGTIKTDPYIFTSIKKTLFDSCQSREFYGALNLISISDVLIELCTFINNKAGTIGGVIGLINSRALIFKSSFINNSCGDHIPTDINNINYKFNYYSKAHFPKGGGAILVRFDSASVRNEYNNDEISMESNEYFNGIEHDFATEECCFINNTNYIIQSADDGLKKYFIGTGSDILLAGNMSYQSFNDAFNHQKIVSIGESGFNGSSSEPMAKSQFYHTIFPEEKSIDFIKKHIEQICPDYSDIFFSHNDDLTFFPETELFTEYPRSSFDDPTDPYQTPYPTIRPDATKLTEPFPTRSDFRLLITDIPFEGRSIHPSPSGTLEFTDTLHFTRSNVFIQSILFSKSSPFSQSFSFSFTEIFTLSSSFIDSIIFSSSSELSESILFTESTIFSDTLSFTKSELYTKSVIFTRSTLFSESIPFTKLLLVSKSISFTQSILFSTSELFSESLSFTQSAFSLAISSPQSVIFSQAGVLSENSIIESMNMEIDSISTKNITPSNNFIFIDNYSNERNKTNILPFVIAIIVGIALASILLFIILYISRRKENLESDNCPTIIENHFGEQFFNNILVDMYESDPFKEDFED